MEEKEKQGRRGKEEEEESAARCFRDCCSTIIKHKNPYGFIINKFISYLQVGSCQFIFFPSRMPCKISKVPNWHNYIKILNKYCTEQ